LNLTTTGVIAKVGDHASRQKLAQHCCGLNWDGSAASAFKDPAHDVPARPLPKHPNSESVREQASQQ